MNFDSTESLSRWLVSTKEGSAVLATICPQWIINNTSLMEPELRAEVDRRMRRRASTLVVCHGDGWLEAYSKDSDCHFQTMLWTPMEILAEKYLELQLPRRYRELFYPRNKVGSHLVQRVGARRELRRRENIQIIAAIKGIQGRQ